MNEFEFILPDWPAPANVHAMQTTRNKGYSHAPYDSLNFGSHVNDNPQHVAQNRQLLSRYLPSEPVWLNQVHGVRVVDAANTNCVPDADASFTTRKNVVCVTMTADCLPVLLCDKAGSVVAAVHAGWRGLCDGALEASTHAVCRAANIEHNQIMAWLGPAIGPNAFEVGSEVREQFIAKDKKSESAFNPHDDKWLGDIYQIATQRLNNLGVTQIYGGGLCTYTDKERFFSFRRDGDTGRMATLIWLA
ncbi:MAG: peptidoglycan editing factor PgeF [Methylotenera sp.]